MPESGEGSDPPSIVRRGIKEVVGWLEQHGIAPRLLSPLELRAYPDRRLRSGWRFEVAFPDRTRTLDILIDHRFPRTPPRIALVDRPPFLTWPHIEEDGVLCVLSEGAEVDPHEPAQVLSHVLNLSSELIEQNVAELNREDFREEFLSYWNLSLGENARKVRSLLTLDSTSRLIKIWRGKEFYLVADGEGEARSWLDRLHHTGRQKTWSFEDGLFLWIDRPMLPSEYPKTGAGLRRLVCDRAPDGLGLLKALVASQPDQVIIVLGARTKHGPCLAGVLVQRPRPSGSSRPKTPLSRGFRPNRVPPSLLANRYFGGDPVSRISVERADASWIHGRDQDSRFPKLRASRVAILGCGSVGAAVAVKLAEAGVGSILLVDPETLSHANIGRHPLGAGGAGAFKTTALARRLLADYPHIIEVNASTVRCEELFALEPNTLSSQDLIISTMGSWSAEGALNEWHLTQERARPIVYGWTEAHACAGHAVLVTNKGGCFGCGMSAVGDPSLRVTTWPHGPTQRSEPACGAIFQP